MTTQSDAAINPASATVSLMRHIAIPVWALLMLATAISWWLGTDHGAMTGNHALSAALVIGIAFLKTYFVGKYFMDLRDAPVALRLVFGGWVLMTGATVIGLYLWLH